MKNKRFIGIMLAASVILLVPLVAMQFTSEVNWSVLDFVVGGFLLLGTGLVCEFVLRKVVKTWHRIAICAGVLVALLLTWAEIAVGIFGTPFAGS